MVRTLTLGLVSVSIAAAPVAAFAAEISYLIKVRVPVHCEVQQRSQGKAAADGAMSLGQFREYCNAPLGYELIVRYAPGTLRGTVLSAGNDTTVLDGSGESVLSRANGPRWIERHIVAKPGDHGFDTDRLELALLPRGVR